MDIKILNVYEQNNQLRVEVETPYGKENIGLNINKKYLDAETDEPKWKSAVKYLLEKKYGTLEERQKKSLSDDKDVKNVLNKKMSLDKLSIKKIEK